jgi:Protein of unknown function (DUF2795)
VGYGRSMERQSNLHSPRVDDELEHEVASLTHGAPVEARVDESRLMEDAGDDEPTPQAIVGELHDAEGGDEVGAGLSRGEVIARSELAIHLRPGIFPAGRDAILECAAEEQAPAAMLGQLRALPHGSYENVQQVWEALGGKRDEGSGHLNHEAEDRDATPAVASAADAGPPVEHAPFSLRFGFRFDSWYRLAALPFGVSPSSAHVDVRTSAEGERLLVAHFGPWTVTTPVTNVLSTAPTGPYAAVKTIGPAHVSLRDLGLTFATNRERGLCIRFRKAVPGLAPTSLIRHPALTVTVEDPEGLARVLAV